MNEEKDFSQIPAGACTLVVGEFELGDNGKGAKSAPVRLVARSGKAIEHWFWGKVVHDLAGMHLHKPRLPIDYVHDSKEVIGYLNRFDITSGDLVTTGALVPFKESDRATEIMHKMAEGVPYEASINFGGDGIKVEEVPEGFITEVNGAKFEGPGMIIREWPLRGVAICPYGADANTDSSALAGNNAKKYKASVFKAVPQDITKDTDMSKKQESVEVMAEVNAPKADEKQELIASVETMPTEEKPVEAVQAVEAAPVEAAQVEEKKEDKPVAEVKAEEEKPVAVLSQAEVCKIADEFGNDIAMKIVRDGGNYEAALKLAYDTMKDENKRLQKVAEEMTLGNGTPVRVVAAPKDGKKPGIFNTGK